MSILLFHTSTYIILLYCNNNIAVANWRRRPAVGGGDGGDNKIISIIHIILYIHTKPLGHATRRADKSFWILNYIECIRFAVTMFLGRNGHVGFRTLKWRTHKYVCIYSGFVYNIIIIWYTYSVYTCEVQGQNCVVRLMRKCRVEKKK